jgi:hypothetical protein
MQGQRDGGISDADDLAEIDGLKCYAPNLPVLPAEQQTQKVRVRK